LALSDKLLQGLNALDFTAMTPVQSEAIPAILQKQDVLVQAPTGTGKTCAFGIPIVETVQPSDHTIQALILCPTRELVLQTTSVLRNLTKFLEGVKIASVYGGERVDKQIVNLRRKPTIVVATPGRAMDFLQRRVLKLGHVKTVVLDEADRMLDMGFRDDIDMILLATPGTRQTVLFSATINNEVARIAKEYQQDAVTIRIGQETATVDSVAQFYIRTESKAKIPTLVKLLQEKKFSSCLVFSGTKSMAETVAEHLAQNGHHAAVLHGDLRQKQRDLVMSQYRGGELDILVATDVAARGIDVSNIDAVINFDIPQNAESYIHRIGRTGRAKQSGMAYTFVYPKELQRLREIMFETKADIQPISILEAAQPENTRPRKTQKPLTETSKKKLSRKPPVQSHNKRSITVELSRGASGGGRMAKERSPRIED
jgi:ATP-dependent RNA helicase DeaD